MTEKLEVLRMGAQARTLLRVEDTSWKVLAAVHGAIYIANPEQELIWITDRLCALHSRAVLLPAMPRRVPEPESPLAAGAGLVGCEAFEIAWRPAETWFPREASPPDGQPADFPEQVRAAIRQAMLAESALGVIAPNAALAGDVGRLTRRASAADAMARDLARGLRTLSCVRMGRDVLPALRTTSYVVGLGEGLTPAGDDILGGYLYALRSADNACRASLGIDWEGVIAWLRGLAKESNAISHCLLVDHARGAACYPLAEFLCRALEGAHCAQLIQLASEVSEIGASSGRSLLAGVAAACSVLRALRRGPLPGNSRLVKDVRGHSDREVVASVR